MAKKLHANYDPLADVLYLSVGQPDRCARSSQDDSGLIWRRSPDGDWLGVTIPDFDYCWKGREIELVALLAHRLPDAQKALASAH